MGLLGRFTETARQHEEFPREVFLGREILRDSARKALLAVGIDRASS